jgi:hypothetical protein
MGFMKLRLEILPLVCVLNSSQIKDLNLPNLPEWLPVYKQNENKIDYLKNVGLPFQSFEGL